MGSVDGRILVERWSQPTTGTTLSDLTTLYAQLGQSFQTDAWAFGKRTVREIFPEEFQSIANRPAKEEAPVFKGKHSGSGWFVSIDPEADIKYTNSTLRGDSILAVVDGSASAEYLTFLQAMDISYLVVADIHDLRDVLEQLQAVFGIQSVLLKGGGALNAGMLAQGVIDELSYVVYPGIDGTAHSTSIFQSLDSAQTSIAGSQSLQLRSAEVKPHGAVWLRYTIHHAR